LSPDETARHHERAIAHADLERVRVGRGRELALDRHAVARTLAADDARPVDLEHGALDLGRLYPRGVHRAHERPHARAGHAVDRNVELVEHPQYADVGGALGASAGEDQRHVRVLGRRGIRVLGDSRADPNERGPERYERRTSGARRT
jgi:hypothetical protein